MNVVYILYVDMKNAYKIASNVNFLRKHKNDAYFVWLLRYIYNALDFFKNSSFKNPSKKVW